MHETNQQENHTEQTMYMSSADLVPPKLQTITTGLFAAICKLVYTNPKCAFGIVPEVLHH